MNIDLDKYEIALVSDGTVRLSIYEDGRSKDHRYVTVESIHLAQARISLLEGLLRECVEREVCRLAAEAEDRVKLRYGTTFREQADAKLRAIYIRSLSTRIDAALKGGK